MSGWLSIEEATKIVDAEIRPRLVASRVWSQVEVGPGWFPILAEMHARLVKLNPNYRLEQVKEKYGELRVYYVFDPDSPYPWTGDPQAVIDWAVDAATKCCESCGSTESVEQRSDVPDGWIKSLCSACRAGRRST